MLRAIMWTWSQGTGGFSCDKTLHELWPRWRTATDRDGQRSTAERMKSTSEVNGECESPAWHRASARSVILNPERVSSKPGPPTFSCAASGVNFSSMWWVFPTTTTTTMQPQQIESSRTHAFRVGWAAPRPQWAGGVTLSICRLTAWHLRLQPPGPFCWRRAVSRPHQRDTALPSLPSQSWSSLCHAPHFSVHLTLDELPVPLYQGEGKFFDLKEQQ